MKFKNKKFIKFRLLYVKIFNYVEIIMKNKISNKNNQLINIH